MRVEACSIPFRSRNRTSILLTVGPVQMITIAWAGDQAVAVLNFRERDAQRGGQFSARGKAQLIRPSVADYGVAKFKTGDKQHLVVESVRLYTLRCRVLVALLRLTAREGLLCADPAVRQTRPLHRRTPSSAAVSGFVCLGVNAGSDNDYKMLESLLPSASEVLHRSDGDIGDCDQTSCAPNRTGPKGYFGKIRLRGPLPLNPITAQAGLAAQASCRTYQAPLRILHRSSDIITGDSGSSAYFRARPARPRR